LNVPLELGRFVVSHAGPGGTPLSRAVTEVGHVRGLPFVLLRLDPETQQLFLPQGSAEAGRYEPTRARAFVYMLVSAINYVVSNEASQNIADSQDHDTSGPTAGPLFTESEQQRLIQAGRRTYDVLALSCIGAFLLVSAVHSWLWARSTFSERFFQYGANP
jgi:hypothetical protein